MTDRYDEIKKRGYHIDVRGVTFLLVRGMVVREFTSWTAALEAAEKEISGNDGTDK